MARPRKAQEERRDDILGARLTSSERAGVEAAAAALGLSPSEFMRRRVLGYRMPPALAARRDAALLGAALNRLGVNLNQIARHMNAGRNAPPDLCALIARIDAALDGVYGSGADEGRAEL